MWKYKGYHLPQDIGLLISLFFLLIYYSLLLQSTSIQGILNRIARLENSPKKQHISITDSEIMLDKVWRGCNFFLSRVFRTRKPCLRRTLVMYRWCCRYSIKTNVIIGICKKGTAINGHSWLLINGTPLKEDMEMLKKYTPMIER